MSTPPTPGTRVKLVKFSTDNSVYDDNTVVPPGTYGTVDSIDDAGTIHMRWDNGSILGLLEVDEWQYADERHVYLRPLIRMTQNPDSTWRVEFDWENSCDGEFIGDDHDVWTAYAEEACRAFDRWKITQPILDGSVVIPDHFIEEDPI